MSKETGHSVLLPPEPQEGGLIIVKSGVKRNPDIEVDSAPEFKVPLPPSESNKPRVSLLGLDRLAEAKRREKQQQQAKPNEDEPTSKRSKVYSYKDGEQEQDYSERRSEPKPREDKSRHYRERDDIGKSATPTPHRLYHQDLKGSRNSNGSKSKGIYASSNNKNGDLSCLRI